MLTIDYDISILLLASPLCFGSAIAPAPLPQPNHAIIAGEPCEVSGWGKLKQGGISPVQLYAVEMTIVSQETCKSAYGADSITDRMVCAGAPEDGKAACHVRFILCFYFS